MMQVQSTQQAQSLTRVTEKTLQGTREVQEQNTQPAKSAKSLSRQDKQVQTLSRWASMAQIGRALAEQEQSERSLRQLYAGLEKLSMQLQQGNSLVAQARVEELQRLAKAPNAGVTTELQAQGQQSGSFARQLPPKIDWLSVRPHDEKIQLLMGRSGKSLQVVLPAGQSEAQNLRSVQQAFSPHHINVGLDNQQRLLFTAASEHAWPLKEPWVMVGEGVRVAAGNPVSVSLQEPEHPLDVLARSVKQERGDVQAQQQQIKQVQRRIRDALVQINSERQQLTARLQQIQQQQPAQPSLSDSAEALQQQITTPRHAISAVMAQGNITRNLVQYSLAE